MGWILELISFKTVNMFGNLVTNILIYFFWDFFPELYGYICKFSRVVYQKDYWWAVYQNSNNYNYMGCHSAFKKIGNR